MATILVADDNADLRELLKILLQKHGFACIEAVNGNEAIEKLGSEKVDLILMDMNMPELDGWQATTAIRTNEAFATLPIIALTAYSLEGDRARAKVAGCNQFHCKPVNFNDLLSNIKLLLQPADAEPISQLQNNPAVIG